MTDLPQDMIAEIESSFKPIKGQIRPIAMTTVNLNYYAFEWQELECYYDGTNFIPINLPMKWEVPTIVIIDQIEVKFQNCPLAATQCGRIVLTPANPLILSEFAFVAPREYSFFDQDNPKNKLTKKNIWYYIKRYIQQSKKEK